MVVVLRYLPCNTVTERFLEFVEVKDKTGVGLCNSIKVVLEPLKLREKLIAQTYDGWDEITISEAYGLSKKLQDRAFLQLLEFFSLLMPEVDVLYNTLQKRSIDAPCINSALAHFKENVQKMRQQADNLAATSHDGTDEPGRRVANTAQFVLSFPTSELDCAVKLWPLDNKEKLKSELITLYCHSELHTGKTALSLLKSIYENNLEEAFAETVILLKIIATTPMMTAESERNFSTLKRIKTFTRNTMGQPRLNALAMLSIESQLIQQLQDFIPAFLFK
ncbi:Zinc finger MYM-type protein 1 [Merluccius polli]|uniref:Zinc finger MYM-type protein 1 n=1 Tax=Merluccius polli TaxID=89951 RepID=A0AA47NCP6_MERPO|nr:Zinc finger MYM-type protein 1 [Merluccius polli]